MHNLATMAIIGLILTACTPPWERPPAAQGVPLSPTKTASSETAAEPVAIEATNLAQLIDQALTRHPAIQAAGSRVQAAAHAREASGRLPEPRLQVAPYGEMAQTATGEVILMTGISQNIPAPGALGAQIEAAEAARQGAIAQLQATRVQVAAGIRRAWWERQVALASRDLVLAQAALLQDLRQQLLQRLSTGRAGQSQILRLELQIDQLQNQARAWQARSERAAATLRAHLHLPAGTPLPEIDNHLPALEHYQIAELRPLARAYRADVLANLAEEQRAQAQARAARASGRPAFGLSFNYNLVDDSNQRGPTSGDDQWWLGVSMSLPLWFDRYRALAAEAEAQQQSMRQQQTAIADRIDEDLRRALAAWQSSHDQLALYRDGLLEQAEQAYQAELAAYTSGNSSFSDIIMAARQILLLQLGQQKLRLEAAQTEADLLQATGLTTAQASSRGDLLEDPLSNRHRDAE